MRMHQSRGAGSVGDGRQPVAHASGPERYVRQILYPFGGNGASLPFDAAFAVPSGVSFARYSGISTPPMSFITCIIGGMTRARLCRKFDVLVVPFPLPPPSQ